MNPYQALKIQYEIQSSGILQHINNNTIVLYFEAPTLTSHTVQTNDQDNVWDFLGGRTGISGITNRFDQGNASGVYQADVTGSIPARVYWNSIKFDKDLNLKDDKDNCKLRTFSKYADSLKLCKYAVIDGYKCTMIKPPKNDGLFGNQWCNSVWEVIG